MTKELKDLFELQDKVTLKDLAKTGITFWRFSQSEPGRSVEPYFEQQTEYKQLKITPTFTLPIYWGTITTYEYEEKSKTLTEKETKELLQQEFSYFCEDLEKKGGQIIQNNVKMYISDATGTACGKITILEKCGVSQKHISEPKVTRRTR